MTLSLPQLTLGLFDDGDCDFADYVAGPNEFALACAEQWSSGDGHWCVLLTGPEQTGKTHLAQAAVRALDRRGEKLMYIPIAELIDGDPAILENLEAIPHLVVDDIDRAASDAAWERALFNLFNRAQAGGCRLLMTAGLAQTQIPYGLADLSSRLSASLKCPLLEISDRDKVDVLRRRAARRGLEIPEKVTTFLMTRRRRNLRELTEVFERIDAASLSAGRELTVPFVRDVLGID